MRLAPTNTKPEVFQEIEQAVKALGFRISSSDQSRPWGGFLVIDESQAREFAAHFFPEEKVSDLMIGNKLSPKILVVQAGKRLSWQYHHRRAEIWKLFAGDAGVVTSRDDSQGEVRKLKTGEIVRLAQGERHRLVGLNGWGVLAEIWQHTDPSNPSDEDDIVRVSDDFGR